MSIKRATVSVVSTPTKHPIEALHEFIEQAKSLQPYSAQWDDPVWEIGHLNVKARSHLPKNKYAYFTPHYPTVVQIENRIPFERGYADLVKACIVRRRIDRGMESGTQLVFLRASRYLYDALPLPVRRDVTRITRGHFVAAEAACLLREKPASAYRVGNFLEELGIMLDRRGLTAAPIDYRSSVRRPPNVSDRTSATFEERLGDLPTAEALDALATIANDARLAERPLDMLRMRIAELLLVGGFRGGEALSIPENPLVREFVFDEGGKLRLDPITGVAVERVGIRYRPEKGGEPIVKWVPTVANPMVNRAIADIDRLCAPARQNALWLEANPGQVNIGVPDDTQLSATQAAKMLNLSDADKFRQWLKRRNRGGMGVLKRLNGRDYISGAALKKAIASDRYDEPVLTAANGQEQTLANTLIVTFLWGWSDNRGPNNYITIPFSLQKLSDFLGGRGAVPSVFQRYNCRNERNETYRFRSHDFRRLLNTVAQRGGLSQIEIARWMGRRRIADNSAYDFRTAAEMANEMRALIGKNEAYGTIVEQVKALPVVEREAFLQNRLTMLHATPLGDCGSNIAENPCETAVSCLGGCKHYLRRKNDRSSRLSLLRVEGVAIEALGRARDAAATVKPTAPNWIESQERVLRTVRAALAIDDDPTLIDGSLYAVSPNGPVLGEPM